MNKNLHLTFLFVVLLLLQVLILNNVLLFGYINPYIYIVFVFVYPLHNNRRNFLLTSFLLGLFVDFFSDSGGIHAFATLFIAYIRLFFVRVIFNKNVTDFSFFDLEKEPFGKVFNYVVSLTMIHHFLLFSLAEFSFQNLINIIINTLFSSIFTVTLFFIGSAIFRKNQL